MTPDQIEIRKEIGYNRLWTHAERKGMRMFRCFDTSIGGVGVERRNFKWGRRDSEEESGVCGKER